jgi:DNA repair protein RadC
MILKIKTKVMEQTMSMEMIRSQVSEIELVYRSKIKASLRPCIHTAKDAEQIFRNAWSEEKIEFVEQFKALFLNRCNKVLAIYEVSTGGITATVVDPRLIFTAALKANATSIIMAHNHPSGISNQAHRMNYLLRK